MTDNENNDLASLAENIAGLATGIPAPIQKNFFKACNQLCTALIDVPVSWLEGQAEIRRKNTEVRKKIIDQIGENLNQQIDVPENYSIKAVEKYASKLIKQQINTDKIIKNASEQLSIIRTPAHTDEEISEEWLNTFEEIAKLKSSEDMQLLFGKILANEIQNPGVFSLKTLNVVSLLDNEVAKAFSHLANSCLFITDTKKIHLSILPNFRDDYLKENNLGYYQITLLQEYGLLHTSESEIKISFFEEHKLTVSIGTKLFSISFIGTEENRKKSKVLTGYKLTTAGCELLNTLSLRDNDTFQDKLNTFLSKSFYQLNEVQTINAS